MHTDPILPKIERHLRRRKISAAKFGLEAVGDPNFVTDLREGREVRRKTRERVLKFIGGNGTPASDGAQA